MTRSKQMMDDEKIDDIIGETKEKKKVYFS